MTITDLDLLKSAEGQRLIAENLATAPSVFALKNRHKSAAILATQIKYLQRSRSKLPSFYVAKAIIPPLAFEQCSSERAASAKDFSGKTCLDLTCGLGVDSLHFSKNFQQVTSIERNNVLAETVRYNFELMNSANIEVINDSAESFVHNYVGEPFDLIYIDPARRDGGGKKVFLPEDCAPNFVELLPVLRKIGKKIVIKMSPLYDVDAAARQFPDVSEIGVISVDNECKELLLVFDNGALKESGSPTIFIKCFYKNQFFIFSKNTEKSVYPNEKINEMTVFSYIIEPDVAFYKARFLEFTPPQYFDKKTTCLTASNGFFLSNNIDNIHDFPSRIFTIEATFTYQPKKISAFLKAQKITALNVVQRNFPFSAADIRTALKVPEGGDWFLICTVFQGEKWAWLAKKHS
ncbi:MAG: RsmD family RNA methyltransferase [Saprospiraceae bacterium]|nr:RsmD family RNA methyltransferase [Saprospiraceae bacterium]